MGAVVASRISFWLGLLRSRCRCRANDCSSSLSLDTEVAVSDRVEEAWLTRREVFPKHPFGEAELLSIAVSITEVWPLQRRVNFLLSLEAPSASVFGQHSVD